MEKPRRAESPDAPMVIPSTNQPRRGSRRRRPDISPQTSYRLDNRNYTGGGKESDEQEVTLCRRKTTTKRRQRRERGQLRHAQVHPECFHHALDVAPLGVVTQTASIQATQSEKRARKTIRLTFVPHSYS